jgi:hypothetical protein
VLAFNALEQLFVQVAQKLQPSIDVEGPFDVTPGWVFNITGTARMAMNMEIGGYLAHAKVLAVQITRRASMKSVWTEGSGPRRPTLVGRWIQSR